MSRWLYNEFILVLDDGATRVFINTDGDRYGISKELVNLIDYISTGEVKLAASLHRVH